MLMPTEKLPRCWVGGNFCGTFKLEALWNSEIRLVIQNQCLLLQYAVVGWTLDMSEIARQRSQQRHRAQQESACGCSSYIDTFHLSIVRVSSYRE